MSYRRYIGGPGLRLAEVMRSLSDGRGFVRPAWLAELLDGEGLLTYRARTALAIACRTLAFGQDDEVLMPSYNCGTEVDPFLKAGLRVILYRVDRTCRIDMEDLIARMGKRTKVVYVTHYFGWPQPLAELQRVCRERGVLLFEDCALSLFSRGANGNVGSEGDVAVYSFAKSLPVPDGGAMAWRLRPPLKVGHLKTGCRRSLRPTAGLLIRSWRSRTLPPCPHRNTAEGLGTTLNAPNEQALPPMPTRYALDPQEVGTGPSVVTLGVLRRTDATTVRETRRRNYLHLHQKLAEMPRSRPLMDELPEGVCPLNYPLWVDDQDAWAGQLRANGVDAGKWWLGRHPDLDWTGFDEAVDLKRHVVALPIHQQVSLEQLDRMASLLQWVAESRRSVRTT